ncbi:unnamed protein product [Blepharisma stoltei]|uniref:Uncharacterized protein n=1 Tax=Blepharisma stoltei TaxID=1481888 RepID=A0AAU9J653_9CILI|nr:unnamed protein product [Blepharisma stoltei]
MIALENEIENLADSLLYTYLYQDYKAAYCRIASLYAIDTISNRTNLFIYDTEHENREEKLLETPEPLNSGTCIAQLPDGELFCFGRSPASGISLKICKNYRVQQLPSGTPCFHSSAIYFNRKVYCFGGENNGSLALSLSLKFDLGVNICYLLTPMPRNDCKCHCILWNDDILIAGFYSANLLRYSTSSDSFSSVSYSFAEKKEKF